MNKDEGFIWLHRRLYKNKQLKTFWEKSAFIFLVTHAEWRDRDFMLPNGKTVALKRGQILASERWLAEELEVSRKKIRGLISKLKSDENEGPMVVPEKGPGATVLTICNYNEYQHDKELGAQQFSKKCTNLNKLINTPPIVPPQGDAKTGSFSQDSASFEEQVKQAIVAMEDAHKSGDDLSVKCLKGLPNPWPEKIKKRDWDYYRTREDGVEFLINVVAKERMSA